MRTSVFVRWAEEINRGPAGHWIPGSSAQPVFTSDLIPPPWREGEGMDRGMFFIPPSWQLRQLEAREGKSVKMERGGTRCEELLERKSATQSGT